MSFKFAFRRVFVEITDCDGRVRTADINTSNWDDDHILGAACTQLNVSPDDVEDWRYLICRDVD